MRLQNLLIIFVVIALPVILILSVYVNYQVDAANLQASYDSTFLGATYDMLSAFQLNSTNNKYSTVSDSLIRDIEASINVFSNSFGTGLGLRGTSKANVLDYVPAILYTLYDGYYIYTPTRSADDVSHYKHTLKPFVYYTEEYTNGNEKIVINYTLDNYVAVYYDSNGSPEKYQSRAGYLEIIAERPNDKVGVYVKKDANGNVEEVRYNGIKIEKEETIEKNEYTYDVLADATISNFKTVSKTNQSTSAYDYYVSAYEFTTWYNKLIQEVKPKCKVKIEDSTIEGGYREENRDFTNILTITENNPVQNSAFNDEKIRVIQDKITNNLIQAMDTYQKKSTQTGTKPEFRMPEFTASDWDKIFNNICVVSFVQGLISGTTTYNNYVILPSTENKQHVSETDLYYIAYNATRKHRWSISQNRLSTFRRRNTQKRT